MNQHTTVKPDVKAAFAKAAADHVRNPDSLYDELTLLDLIQHAFGTDAFEDQIADLRNELGIDREGYRLNDMGEPTNDKIWDSWADTLDRFKLRERIGMKQVAA